jgi:hypothetical protein
MGWSFDIKEFQSRLQSNKIVRTSLPNPVGRVRPECMSAACLWHLTHLFLINQLEQGSAMTVIGIEDNLTSPEKVAMRLHKATGILPTPLDVAQSDDGNVSKLPNKAHIKNRSTESVTQYWQKILTHDEVAYVRGLNDDLYKRMQAWLI